MNFKPLLKTLLILALDITVTANTTQHQDFNNMRDKGLLFNLNTTSTLKSLIAEDFVKNPNMTSTVKYKKDVGMLMNSIMIKNMKDGSLITNPIKRTTVDRRRNRDLELFPNKTKILKSEINEALLTNAIITSTVKNTEDENWIVNPNITRTEKSKLEEGLVTNPIVTSTTNIGKERGVLLNPFIINPVKSRRNEEPPPMPNGMPNGMPTGMPNGMQGMPGMPEEETPTPKSNVGHVNEAVKAAAQRFSAKFSSTTKKFVRTTPRRVSFKEDCDYLAHYCLKAYDTGVLCGRTIYYKYYTFKNYCLMDYVNCMERYEVWQVVHMGECFTVKELTEYVLYPYDDDFFLDQYYIVEDN